MRIRIKDTNICDGCTKKNCSNNDVIEKNAFAKFRSERYTCPVKLFQYGPTDKQMDEGYIDISFGVDSIGCMYCCLCAIQCNKDNIEIIDYSFKQNDDFLKALSLCEKQSGGCCNILALSYLDLLFDFAANTNINKAMSFDGFMCDKNDNWFFVEVDANDDSLESCRRLLGDIVSQNHNSDRKIDAGLMVLNNLPQEGSRDVYTFIEKIKQFPNTKHLKIYATTFTLLRHFAINVKKNKYTVDDLLFNMSTEQPNKYVDKLMKLGLLNGKTKDNLF